MKGWIILQVFCAAFYTAICVVPFNSDGHHMNNRTQTGNDVLDVFLPTLKSLDARCAQDKDQEAVDNVRVKLDILLKCATRSLEAVKNFAQNLVSDLKNQLDTAQKLQTVVGRACRSFRTIKRCSKKANDWARACLTPKELEDSTKIFNAIMGIMGYFCGQNATKLFDFLQNGGHVCALSHGGALQQCLTEVKNMTHPEGTVPALDEEKCMTFSEVTTCAITEFSKCPNKEPVGFLRETFDVVWKELPCLELQYLNTF